MIKIKTKTTVWSAAALAFALAQAPAQAQVNDYKTFDVEVFWRTYGGVPDLGEVRIGSVIEALLWARDDAKRREASAEAIEAMDRARREYLELIRRQQHELYLETQLSRIDAKLRKWSQFLRLVSASASLVSTIQAQTPGTDETAKEQTPSSEGVQTDQPTEGSVQTRTERSVEVYHGGKWHTLYLNRIVRQRLPGEGERRNVLTNLLHEMASALPEPGPRVICDDEPQVCQIEDWEDVSDDREGRQPAAWERDLYSVIANVIDLTTPIGDVARLVNAKDPLTGKPASRTEAALWVGTSLVGGKLWVKSGKVVWEYRRLPENIINAAKRVGHSIDSIKAPKGWIVIPSLRGSGVLFVPPKGGHASKTSIRFMPGNEPHGNWPYAKVYLDGRYVDVMGRPTTRNAPAAHIPLEKFNKEFNLDLLLRPLDGR